MACFTAGGSSGKRHSSAYPNCPESWHDMYDHPSAHCTFAAAERMIAAGKGPSKFSAVELLAVRFPNVSAYDLVRLGECTGLCLVAADDSDCDCRCGGMFHGALMNVIVEPRGSLPVDDEYAQWDAFVRYSMR